MCAFHLKYWIIINDMFPEVFWGEVYWSLQLLWNRTTEKNMGWWKDGGADM